ncbi:PE family protein [Mycobacterium riyadhense]|uniref:PE family protein n=1 Tax=Mycobacterium riyadhense TaxID=486698 RepID=UPI001950F503
MSFVIAAPELLGTAATELAGLDSTLSAANAAAAAQTTTVLAAAEDEVSAAIAALFAAHGQAYQAAGIAYSTKHDGLNPFRNKGLRPSFLFSTINPRINAPTFSGRSS